MSEKSPLVVELENLQLQAEAELVDLKSENALQSWRTQYLGRSATVMQIFKRLPETAPEQRAAIGQFANQVKNSLETRFNQMMDDIKQAQLQQNLQGEQLDVTLPGRAPARGRLHIQTKVLREICHIFNEMGFQVFRTDEVESDEYNFELLNIPAYHPARDMWDTFYTTKDGVILRTHTSPGQVRAMRAFHPDPIRVVLPGMCYRYEQMDASHEIQFNQVEVLVVGKDITFANMKGTLEEFAKRMYGKRRAHAHPPRVLPLHGTQRRDGRGMFRVRPQRLPGLQGQRLAGNSGLRHGAPHRAAERRLRPRDLFRICRRHGRRTYLHAALPD